MSEDMYFWVAVILHRCVNVMIFCKYYIIPLGSHPFISSLKQALFSLLEGTMRRLLVTILGFVVTRK